MELHKRKKKFLLHLGYGGRIVQLICRLAFGLGDECIMFILLTRHFYVSSQHRSTATGLALRVHPASYSIGNGGSSLGE